MREDPGLETGTISAALKEHYGLQAATITYLPIGYDPNAAVYEAIDAAGTAWFLKIRSGPIHEPSLQAPRALLDHGIPNVLAPLRTRSSALWGVLDDRRMVLYPFIRGENAMNAGMTDDQWRQFGATLRAVHDSGLEARWRGHLPVESFALPSAALVREVQAAVDAASFQSAAARRFARFWQERAGNIAGMIDRAEELGARLHVQGKSFDQVLCHADIHGANILVGEDGEISLVDWDGPIIAPRERDLLFVVGSKIARDVTPREETLFFEGYGPAAIDPEALIYYRYERIIEDLGEFGKSVFLTPHLSEAARDAEAAMARSFFAPGRIIESAETVILPPASRATVGPPG